MTAFTVWKFDEPDGAEHALRLLRGAQDDNLIEVVDHAVVTWPRGSEGPEMRHGHDNTRRGAGKGAFWGLLAGALFTVPVVGVAAGAAIGAASKRAEGLGISEEELDRMREQITEGTSALFVVTEAGDLDRVGERFRGLHMTLVQTNLTDAERAMLLETFDS